MVPVPPTVSIVVRSHNDIRFIRETLSMLLAQDFPDLEILSCDDASTDGTAACIDEFSGIRKLSRPEGAYVPGRTLNIAVQACRGEIIVFNNADAVPCAREYISELVAPFLIRQWLPFMATSFAAKMRRFWFAKITNGPLAMVFWQPAGEISFHWPVLRSVGKNCCSILFRRNFSIRRISNGLNAVAPAAKKLPMLQEHRCDIRIITLCHS